MRCVALPFPVIALLSLAACSEARSDIENLEPKVLEAEAKALSESAMAATQGQVKQIQPMAIDDVERDSEILEKISK